MDFNSGALLAPSALPLQLFGCDEATFVETLCYFFILPMQVTPWSRFPKIGTRWDPPSLHKMFAISRLTLGVAFL
jgi:hypothetical protein